MTLTVTGRLVAAVLLSVAGLLMAVLSGRPEAAVLAAPWMVLLVLGIAEGAPAPFRAALRTERDRYVAGAPVSIDITVDDLDGGWVEAGWRPPERLLAVTDGRPDDAVEAPMLATGAVVDRHGRAELTCSLPAAGWGTHDIGRVAIGLHRPYGLIVARSVAHQPLPIRVHPHPIDLRRLLAPRLVRRLTGAHRSRAAGRGIEYADIRPFGPGDSPRDINWRASARNSLGGAAGTGELMVSDRHPDRSTHAILLLDSFADSGHDTLLVLSDAIEAALALAESHLSVSDRVGLVDFGGVLRWVTPGTGRHQLERMVDALLATRLYHSDAERSITALPARALPPRSFIVALSPLLDPRFIDGLFVLRAAGHDLAVVESTPPIDETGERWRDDRAPAVALRLWRAERQVQRDRLAGTGMAVVERNPADGGGTGGDGDEPWDAVLHRLAVARRRIGPPVRG